MTTKHAFDSPHAGFLRLGTVVWRFAELESGVIDHLASSDPPIRGFSLVRAQGSTMKQLVDYLDELEPPTPPMRLFMDTARIELKRLRRLRKNLLEYDNVANEQRKSVYELRDELMSAERVTPIVDDIRPDVVAALVPLGTSPRSSAS